MADTSGPRKRLLVPRTLNDVKKHLDGKLKPFVIPNTRFEWESQASRIRSDVLGLFSRGHKSDLFSTMPAVRWVDTLETKAGYRIRKLLYEGYPGLWIPALLYEPENLDGKVPVVLNPNGHHAGGKSMKYKQARCINLAKRGMLALSTEFIGMGELRASGNHGMLAYLHLTGLEGVGIFYAALKRSLDVLLSHPSADPNRVAVTGLSGGGWQTLMLSALDMRVTVAVPVAGHSPIWQRVHCEADIGDLEQLTPDLCTVADYDTLTALIAPRPLLLMYNKMDDCCFRPSRTRSSIFKPVKELYTRFYDKNLVEFHVNQDPGTHNYGLDNRQQLYKFLNRHFALDTPYTELDWESEVYTERELATGVPRNNATFHSLAVDAVSAEPAPEGKASSIKDRRARLKSLVKVPLYRLLGVEKVSSAPTGAHTRQFILSLDEFWRLPVTVHQTGESAEPVLLLGKAKAKNLPQKLRTGRDYLQVHCDILGTGEMEIPNNYHQLLNAAGERSLGIMVAQIGAVIDWLLKTYDSTRTWIAVGSESTGLAALVYAALFPKKVTAIEPAQLPTSLSDLIKTPVRIEGAEALFSFGLLKEFDIYDLIDLAVGVPIRDEQRGGLGK